MLDLNENLLKQKLKLVLLEESQAFMSKEYENQIICVTKLKMEINN